MANLAALQAQGKAYQYQLFSELGHNTSFAKSGEPLEAAIKWLASLSRHPQRTIHKGDR